MLGSVRTHVHIARSADDVWARIGDPARVHEWWPGIVSTVVEGDTRTITLASGLPMPEIITILDPLQRRFQYQITAGIVQHHRSTLDVLDMGDGTSVVSYACDADPRTFALMIGAGGSNALAHLKATMEAESGASSSDAPTTSDPAGSDA